MGDLFITLIASAVGNERDGFRIAHYWDGATFATKAEAVRNGFREAGSDDFNVGIVRSGKLLSVWWMDEQIDEPAETLAEISREIGLTAR